MTDERRERDRDISIAKKLGWRVVVTGEYCELLEPDRTEEAIEWLACSDTINEAWEGVPHYSTDPAACMALLVEVMGRGFDVSVERFIRKGTGVLTTAANLHDEGEDYPGYSTLTDPALAFCDAVSQACDAALEAEVKA